jgi:plasmid stabilization system protein ParE
MSAYALTPRARRDIFEIWSYIAADSVEAADRVEHAIFDACAFLAEGPMRGHVRVSLTTRPVASGRSRVIRITPLSIAPKQFHYRSSPSCTASET